MLEHLSPRFAWLFNLLFGKDRLSAYDVLGIKGDGENDGNMADRTPENMESSKKIPDNQLSVRKSRNIQTMTITRENCPPSLFSALYFI